MNLTRHTNSWHWLLMAIAGCLLIVSYPCHLVSKKATEENAPKLLAMGSHTDELVLLREEDVTLIEFQVAEIQKRTNAYETAVREKAIQPIPKGEQSVLRLGNEISRALLKHQLRVIQQEQESNPEESPAVPTLGVDATPQERRAAAVQQAAAAKTSGKDKQSVPFQTREIRYVVEGEYKHMFMFLVKQSHLKPSYHFKGIRIVPSPQQYGMRMEFTVLIHFT